MGGRRSRYWCGPGIFRETKKAPVRGFIGQWSAPSFLITRKVNKVTKKEKRTNETGKHSLTKTSIDMNPTPSPGSRPKHRFPRLLVAADAQHFIRAHQWQPQQCGVAFNLRQQFPLADFHILQPGIDIGLAFGIEQRRNSKSRNKSPDLGRSHRL